VRHGRVGFPVRPDAAIQEVLQQLADLGTGILLHEVRARNEMRALSVGPDRCQRAANCEASNTSSSRPQMTVAGSFRPETLRCSHNFDLLAARKEGFRSAFVRRPEEWSPRNRQTPLQTRHMT
jgi:hypothetical protein